MVFKARFFSSKKSDSSSSPDGSNSPGGSAFASTSSARSEKKKSKSPSSVSSPRHTVFRNAVEKQQQQQQQLHKKKDKDGKESKGKEAANSPSPKPSPPTAPSALSKLRRTPATVAVEVKDDEGAPPIAALSPILASSLGLNRIKTRSGPLPQEGSRGEHRMSGIGSSNLSRAAGYTSMTGGKAVGVSSTGTKKDGRHVVKVAESFTSSWVDRGTSGAKQWSTVSADAPFERQGNIGNFLLLR